MSKINIENIIGTKSVINCETQKQATKLFEYLSKHKAVWGGSGDDVNVNNNHWRIHKKNTCINVNDLKSITYGDYNYFKNISKIIKFDEIEFDNKKIMNNRENKEMKKFEDVNGCMVKTLKEVKKILEQFPNRNIKLFEIKEGGYLVILGDGVYLQSCIYEKLKEMGFTAFVIFKNYNMDYHMCSYTANAEMSLLKAGLKLKNEQLAFMNDDTLVITKINKLYCGSYNDFSITTDEILSTDEIKLNEKCFSNFKWTNFLSSILKNN